MTSILQILHPRHLSALSESNRIGHIRSRLRWAQVTQGDRDIVFAERHTNICDLEEAGVQNFVVRAQQNLTARRSEVISAEPGKRGRKPTLGKTVRPLPRCHKGKVLDATEPDREETFRENGRELQARWFDRIVVTGCSRVVSCLVIKDPRYKYEWVLLMDLSNVSAATVYRLYRSKRSAVADKSLPSSQPESDSTEV